MKQTKLSILFPRQDEVVYREIPEESWHDLGLDTLTEKVASQPQEIPLLRRVMMRHGFIPIDCEWWHFTLQNEPYPDTYFEFPVSSADLRR